MLLGYLGPRGTFSEEAAIKYSQQAGGNLDLREYPAIDQIMEALCKKEIGQGIVPLENSLEGSINITLDLLASSREIFIYQEIICPVTHHLVAAPGMEVSDIKELYSHPQVFSQCRAFINQNLPQVKKIPWHSTAAAALMVSWPLGRAAIVSRRAAGIYKLKMLASHIQDNNGNKTRFVVLGREDHKITGEDKTSLVFSIKDGAGSLYSVLGVFARRGINLTRIESRPARKSLGDYIFFIDLEGHCQDHRIKEAMCELEDQVVFKKMLGSYPRGGHGDDYNL